ncbi:SH3 domain-containing protein [Octadecabacter sp.]|jgi:hypothetical protein|nr:SH3 domain-containing protein [Octadecabacter sp.]
MNFATRAAGLAAFLLTLLTGQANADICQPTDQSVFQVIGVNSDDTLNVRSGPTTQYPVVAELGPTATNVRYAGDIFFKDDDCRLLCGRQVLGDTSVSATIQTQCLQRNQIWFMVQTPDNRIGWASSKFLMELPQVARSEETAPQGIADPNQNVQNVTNVTVQNSITALQADLDAKATSAAVLMELINQQRTLSESGSDISLFALTVLEQLGGELNGAIQDLQAEAQSQYGTPVRPNNGNNDLSARERSKNFPPVPYYVAGQEGNGEFWLEPLVKDTGELVYILNFIDPEEQNERITSNFGLSLNELSQIRTALDTVYEWSETAQSNRIRRRYEKTAVCFPAVQCGQKVQGNTSTQVDFLIYEDGATGARIIRNKGAFVEPYNMSIESVALLAAYLDYVATAAEAEFNAGTATEESLDALFE